MLGSQPVSLSKENISLLIKEPYLVSWKADGTRFMLLIQRESAYLTDRDFRIFHIPHLHFPRKGLHDLHSDTLIDGELVIDRVDEKTVKPRFLMYDLVTLNGVAMPADYAKRLEILREEVFIPREMAKTQKKFDFSKEPFGIRCKDFYPLAKIQEVFQLLPKLPHENDGLILAPNHQAYLPGRDNKLLKWKPPHLNTVDFRLDVEKVQKEHSPTEVVYRLLLAQGGDKVFGQLSFDTLNKEEVKKFRCSFACLLFFINLVCIEHCSSLHFSSQGLEWQDHRVSV